MSELSLFCPKCGEKITPFRASWGGWIVEKENCIVTADGQSFHFKPVFTQILTALVTAHGNLVSQISLFDYLYGDLPEIDWPSQDCMKSQLSYCRSRLKRYGFPSAIRTVFKGGYRIVPVVEAKTGDMEDTKRHFR